MNHYLPRIPAISIASRVYKSKCAICGLAMESFSSKGRSHPGKCNNELVRRRVARAQAAAKKRKLQERIVAASAGVTRPELRRSGYLSGKDDFSRLSDEDLSGAARVLYQMES